MSCRQCSKLLEVARGMSLLLQVFNVGAFKGLMGEPEFFEINSLFRKMQKIADEAIAEAEANESK